MASMRGPEQLAADSGEGSFRGEAERRSGLKPKGRNDFKFEYVMPPQGVPVLTDSGKPPPTVEGPTIFSALPEQLGLRLRSQKGPVEVLVIDHIERPSANRACRRGSRSSVLKRRYPETATLRVRRRLPIGGPG